VICKEGKGLLQKKKPNKRYNSCKRLLNETKDKTAVKSFFNEKAGCE